MIITELKKIKLRVYIIALIITAAFSFILMRGYGKKDVFSVFIATYMLLLQIYLLCKNTKASLLFFIISIPILVTGRKLCYFNFFIFRVTYETIYISSLFIVSFNKIYKMIRGSFKSLDKNQMNFFSLLFVLIIFAYNSCFFSTEIVYSLGEVYIGLITPSMFMLSVLAICKKEDVRNLLYYLFIAIDLSCLYGFMQIAALRIPVGEIIKNRGYITFGYHNINIFATIIVTVIPMVLYYIIFAKNSRKEKIFLAITLILNITSLLLTYSRGAWICVIISIIIIVFNRKYRKTIIFFGALMFIVMKPVSSFILTRGTYISLWQNTSIIARVQGIFTDFIIMYHLPFGGGPGMYPDLYKKYALTGYMFIPESIRFKIGAAPYALESAHNLFLSISVELGIVCLILFLLIIINRIIAIFKNYNENKVIFSGIMSYLIISMLTGSELNHKGVITGTLLLFLYFGIIELNKE